MELQNFYDYTPLIYKNPAVDIIDKDGNFSIVANKDLKQCELILLELPIQGTQTHAESVVASVEYLFDELYPRRAKWNTLLQKERIRQSPEKVLLNAFSMEGEHVIGNVLSKFNHNCSPNVAIDGTLPVVNATTGKETSVVCALTMRPIKKGEELTIKYSYHTGHNDLKYHFVCNCGVPLEQRISKHVEVARAARQVADQQKYEFREQIHGVLKKFTQDNLWGSALMLHHIAKDGMYFANEYDRIFTKQFQEMLKEKYGKGKFMKVYDRYFKEVQATVSGIKPAK